MAASPTISIRGRRSSPTRGLGQLAADPGAEQGVVLDEDDPNGHRRLRGTRSSISVPAPGCDVSTAAPPARWSRPTIESLMPRRSSGMSLRVEPAPGVADEPGELGVVGLDEHVDAVDLGVAGGVDEGLAEGGEERPRGLVEGLVADDDGLDADVVVGLDLDREGFDRGVERSSARPGRASRRARPGARVPGGGRGWPSGAGRRCAGSAPATAAPSRGGARRRPPARPRGCASPARRRAIAAGARRPVPRTSPARRRRRRSPPPTRRRWPAHPCGWRARARPPPAARRRRRSAGP